MWLIIWPLLFIAGLGFLAVPFVFDISWGWWLLLFFAQPIGWITIAVIWNAANDRLER